MSFVSTDLSISDLCSWTGLRLAHGLSLCWLYNSYSVSNQKAYS